MTDASSGVLWSYDHGRVAHGVRELRAIPGLTLCTMPSDFTDDLRLAHVLADDADALSPALGALATVVRQGALGRLTVERADGENILATGARAGALREALESAGFVATPRGLRLRG